VGKNDDLLSAREGHRARPQVNERAIAVKGPEQWVGPEVKADGSAARKRNLGPTGRATATGFVSLAPVPAEVAGP